MAFMGTFEVQCGKWGGMVDWVYTDIGSRQVRHARILDPRSDASARRDRQPEPRHQDQHPDAGRHVFVHRKPELQHGPGVRRTHAGHGPHAELGLQRHRPGRHRRVRHERSQLDELGRDHWRARPCALRQRLRWFVPYYADVGGGDSKLTWQAIVASDTRSDGATSSSYGVISTTNSIPASLCSR